MSLTTSEGYIRLAARLGEILRGRGMTLAVAESCTGGLLAHMVTDVPGSSDYFLGGVVAYANSVKREVLGVREETLDKYGAVSAETAREMAAGVRRLLGADVAVGITGIAGPGGGTPEKPVGLVYIGMSTPDGEMVERHEWDGDRWENKASSAERALAWLCEYLEGAGDG